MGLFCILQEELFNVVGLLMVENCVASSTVACLHIARFEHSLV